MSLQANKTHGEWAREWYIAQSHWVRAQILNTAIKRKCNICRRTQIIMCEMFPSHRIKEFWRFVCAHFSSSPFWHSLVPQIIFQKSAQFLFRCSSHLLYDSFTTSIHFNKFKQRWFSTLFFQWKKLYDEDESHLLSSSNSPLGIKYCFGSFFSFAFILFIQ